MSKFKIGDRVKIIENIYCWKESLYGCTGTICDIISNPLTPYGVAFDNLTNGHDCDGHCEDDSGWYVSESDLELIEKTIVATLPKKDKSLTITCMYKGENKMNAKSGKKTLEQQIKERYAKKRTELNKNIGFNVDMSLEPKKFYYDPESQTTIIDFGNKEKFKAKPAYGDEFNLTEAYEVIAAKRIYSRFGNFPFEKDMSSLESKLTAKFLLYKNTGIVFSKYVKYIKNMVDLLTDEKTELLNAEEIRMRQKEKNKEREERRKARKSWRKNNRN